MLMQAVDRIEVAEATYRGRRIRDEFFKLKQGRPQGYIDEDK